MSDLIMHFVTPPVPYFIDSGKHTFFPGERHVSRYSISVFDIIIVTKGTLFIGENDNEWIICKDEAIILRPDAYHYGTTPCEDETEITWIHFQTFGAWDEMKSINECYENQITLFEKHKQQAYLNHCEVSSIFIPKKLKLSSKSLNDLTEFYSLNKDPRSLRNWRKQTAFQNFMQNINHDSAVSINSTAILLAEKIELFIRQNYASKITNSVLKAEFNYHPNYLAKCMLKAYGVTPIVYLLQYRIEQAKKLLIQTDWSIARIADELGFSTPAYFSSVFTNKQGFSPANFRKKEFRKPELS
ncbi:helix-turn-helix transcriptional regulator [Paenibacillus endoradicis]|uniref:helix-turn-helix transcriptional regulator n=1 Tax=Paenibacillus endoradicis TaxID=2972487 RepID=UPI002159B4F1|nr:AraC family transcriptional regulator [Paenibacillus endoradicis]MCR8657754.1 AraC family transcriptional regulator [Paenibacillus endoradicis]